MIDLSHKPQWSTRAGCHRLQKHGLNVVTDNDEPKQTRNQEDNLLLGQPSYLLKLKTTLALCFYYFLSPQHLTG